MWRSLVLLLVMVNGAYFAWAQGFLNAYGIGPVERSEPHRMAQQIRPEGLRVLSAVEAQRLERLYAPAATTSAKTCWVAGVFDDAQASALGSAMEGKLPSDSWRLERIVQPARWIVYMGRYDSPDAVTKKRAELRALNVVAESLRNPTLEPGLSLGGYDTSTAANAAMTVLAQRGVRTAKVVQERAEVRGLQLRLPQADEALKAAVESFRPQLAGKVLQSCPQ